MGLVDIDALYNLDILDILDSLVILVNPDAWHSFLLLAFYFFEIICLYPHTGMTVYLLTEVQTKVLQCSRRISFSR